jgi:hypothetical protein
METEISGATSAGDNMGITRGKTHVAANAPHDMSTGGATEA